MEPYTQAAAESVDAYVTAVKKLARAVNVEGDPAALRNPADIAITTARTCHSEPADDGG